MSENFMLPAPGELPVIERRKPVGDPAHYQPFNFEGTEVAALAAYGSEYAFHITSSMHGTNGYSNNDPQNAAQRVAQLHRKIEEHRQEIVITKSYDTEDCETLIVATGAVTRAARDAAGDARKNGVKVGVLQLLTIWPFPNEEIMVAAKNVKRIIVPEMNYSGQLADEIAKLFGTAIPIHRVNSFNGQIITPSDILQAIR